MKNQKKANIKNTNNYLSILLGYAFLYVFILKFNNLTLF